MTILEIKSRECRQLEALVFRTNDASVLRRVQALLWLGAGDEIDDIAKRLCVSRRTIYYWVERFQTSDGRELAARLADKARSGRPPTAHGIIDPLIDQIIDTDPRDAGYASTVWTAGLLQHYLIGQHQVSVSRRSISYALERLEIRWKRPRHTLSRRAKFWRQAKGG